MKKKYTGSTKRLVKKKKVVEKLDFSVGYKQQRKKKENPVKREKS